MTTLQQALKCFDSAVACLACSEASLAERLEQAAGEIAALQERDFSPDLRSGFQRVTGALADFRQNPEQPWLRLAAATAILEMCLLMHRLTWE